MEITRRSFGLAAAGAALLPALPAAAKEAPAGAQVPGVYRMKVGTYEVTVLNDGWLPIDAILYCGDKPRREKTAAGRLPAGTRWRRPRSTQWLINTGDKLILVDTGTSNVIGSDARPHARRRLAAAGVNPADIDAVVISHIHPDHCRRTAHARQEGGVPERDRPRQCRRVRMVDRRRYESA